MTYSKRVVGMWSSGTNTRIRVRTAMNEHEFRRAIFLVIWRLFDANLCEVPHINAAIARCRRENGGAVWGPCEVQHLVRMCLKRVQGFPQPLDVV
jgi:hypothetical protein